MPAHLDWVPFSFLSSCHQELISSLGSDLGGSPLLISLSAGYSNHYTFSALQPALFPKFPIPTTLPSQQPSLSSPSRTPTLNNWLLDNSKGSGQHWHPPFCLLITILSVRIPAHPFIPAFPQLQVWPLPDTAPALAVLSYCCCEALLCMLLVFVFTKLALLRFPSVLTIS